MILTAKTQQGIPVRVLVQTFDLWVFTSVIWALEHSGSEFIVSIQILLVQGMTLANRTKRPLQVAISQLRER